MHAAVRYVDNPELLQSLADEYVVGTLAGRARRRFERLSETHAAARDAVRQAEDRLVALSVALRPVEPRAETWTRIDSRTGGTDRAGADSAAPQKRARLPTTRWALAAAFAIAVLGLSWLVFQQEPRPTALASAVGLGSCWKTSHDRPSTAIANAAANAHRVVGRRARFWGAAESAPARSVPPVRESIRVHVSARGSTGLSATLSATSLSSACRTASRAAACVSESRSNRRRARPASVPTTYSSARLCSNSGLSTYLTAACTVAGSAGRAAPSS